jgi:endonuclease III
MPKRASRLAKILDRLEKFYGPRKPSGPLMPYEAVLHRNCGYPQSDERCDKGFAALRDQIGLAPEKILAVPDAKLRAVMKPSVMLPALSARRLKEIAARVAGEFGGDLRAAMKRPVAEVRKALKKFPTVADATADKILLFSRTAPVPAVPSNCAHVPLRLGFGREQKNWLASYRSAQQAIARELPPDFDALIRAYVLLKHHGQETCKLSRPRCDACPVSSACAYYKKLCASRPH